MLFLLAIPHFVMPNDTLRRRLASLWPTPMQPDWRERTRAAAGGIVGLLFMAWLCKLAGAHMPGSPWMLAPLGASAVLVFAVPSGPLAQPWSVVVGNTLSAVVGTAFALTPLEPLLSGPLAVGAAIAVMMLTRSLHPPGGAVALTAVLTHTTVWTFPLFPVLINSVLLVAAGMVYNSLSGRPYPHRQASPRSATPSSAQPTPSDDLDTVLRRYNQVLDVSRDDLEALLHETERLTYRRRLNELRCERIMSRDLITVQFGTSLQQAWDLLEQHHIKALPVVDRYNHLVGIVTRTDFLRHANIISPNTLARRLQRLLKPSLGTKSNKAEVVGQIMTREVRVASAHKPITALMPLFTEGKRHHIPIVGEDRKLVGIITQSDFLRAWSRAVLESWQSI